MSNSGKRHLRIVRIDDNGEELDDLDFLDDSAAHSEAGLREEVTETQSESDGSGHS